MGHIHVSRVQNDEVLHVDTFECLWGSARWSWTHPTALVENILLLTCKKSFVLADKSEFEMYIKTSLCDFNETF